MKTFVRAVPFLSLLCAAMVLMGANPFKGETTAPMDLLLSKPGWTSTGMHLPPRHAKRSDVLDYKIPSWLALKRQLREGRLPLWNDLTAGGVPGLQLVSRSALTPAFLVFVLIEDDALAFYFSNLVNLILAAMGMYLFLRCLSLERWAALFGAFVFAFSGFHAAWFYLHHMNTAIWIP